jgi:hypothetical protein
VNLLVITTDVSGLGRCGKLRTQPDSKDGEWYCDDEKKSSKESRIIKVGEDTGFTHLIVL